MPETLHALEIPEELQRTLSGAKFLVKFDKEHEILVFATETNFQLLGKADEWYMDGTFQVYLNFLYKIKRSWIEHL